MKKIASKYMKRRNMIFNQEGRLAELQKKIIVEWTTISTLIKSLYLVLYNLYRYTQINMQSLIIQLTIKTLRVMMIFVVAFLQYVQHISSFCVSYSITKDHAVCVQYSCFGYFIISIIGWLPFDHFVCCLGIDWSDLNCKSPFEYVDCTLCKRQWNLCGLSNTNMVI